MLSTRKLYHEELSQHPNLEHDFIVMSTMLVGCLLTFVDRRLESVLVKLSYDYAFSPGHIGTDVEHYATKDIYLTLW